ncbi:MAG: hypothetical protein KF878_15395 [Planctomycetes bacterium]|nr:hypothetical protein [Planctomycetota bacterium]
MGFPNQDSIEYLPPPSGELMRSAIADFAAKDLDERVRILQGIGILDENGDMMPDYSGDGGDSLSAEQSQA